MSKTMFMVVEKQGPHGVVLVVTDVEILGKVFTEGKKILDLSKSFYQGKPEPESVVRTLMGAAQVLHLSGKKIVALGVEMGLVERKRILWVDGVPHAEVVQG